MTTEQVTELGQALEILSAKSSVIKERTELRKLIEENKESEGEEVRIVKILARDRDNVAHDIFIIGATGSATESVGKED